MEISVVSASTPTKISASSVMINGGSFSNSSTQPSSSSNVANDQNNVNVKKNMEETVNIPTSFSTNTNTEQVIFTGERSSSSSSSSYIALNSTECISAVTETVSSSEKDFHVLKIQISPEYKVKDQDKRDHWQTIVNSSKSSDDHTLISNATSSLSVIRDQVDNTDHNSTNLTDQVKKCKVSVISLGPNSEPILSSVKQTSSIVVNSSGSDNNTVNELNTSRIVVNKNLENLISTKSDTQSLLIKSDRADRADSGSFDSEPIHIASKTLTPQSSPIKPIATTPTITEMVQKPSGDLEVTNPTYLYYMMTSGQCSPSDTLDSGTCSDMENNNTGGNANANGNENGGGTPPSLPKKIAPKLKMHLKSTKIMMQEQNGMVNHNRTGSFTDSEESESSLSCDSLNSSEFARNHGLYTISTSSPTPPLPPIEGLVINKEDNLKSKIPFLPDSLLRDIRDRKYNKDTIITAQPALVVDTDTYENRFKTKISVMKHLQNVEENDLEENENSHSRDKNTTRVLITSDVDKKIYDTDQFYTFHIHEKDNEDYDANEKPSIIRDDESFAGYKDIHSGTSTIRSSKGTIRGVKNRVRNGIATFLQLQQPNVKNYKEKDSGKVVLYTTSMGIVRQTYAKCSNVKQILRTLLIKFEERDVFMSNEYQQEIKERMQTEEINVPQLYVEGQHIGDAETVERLNESGELRKMLKPYKSLNSSQTCQTCGGYRLLPCQSCNGSKKSVHRNHFTAEFVALKCMNCDEVGLVKCHNC